MLHMIKYIRLSPSLTPQEPGNEANWHIELLGEVFCCLFTSSCHFQFVVTFKEQLFCNYGRLAIRAISVMQTTETVMKSCCIYLKCGGTAQDYNTMTNTMPIRSPSHVYLQYYPYTCLA